MINLCFHGIGRPGRELEPGEDEYWISPELFHATLDLAAGRPEVALSFDDGNESDVLVGLPALRQRGLVAEFFLIAARLDQPGSVSTAQVGELVAAGMPVGSHGMHHRSWRGLGPSEREEELHAAPRRLAEVVGRPVATAACPRGEYDRGALRDLRTAGFDRVYTSDRAVADPHAWLQPRYSVRAGDTEESVRSLLEDPPGPVERLRSRARVRVKSWR